MAAMQETPAMPAARYAPESIAAFNKFKLNVVTSYNYNQNKP